MNPVLGFMPTDPWKARAEREAQALKDDPFHKVREYSPRFKDLDFMHEYQEILAKRSKLSARDRSFVVNMVEVVNKLSSRGLSFAMEKLNTGEVVE